MLESILIITFSVGVVAFLIALFEQWETLMSLILSFISIMFLLYTWASSVYVQVPSDTGYNEIGFGILCFGLVIVDIIAAIVSIFNITVYAKRGRY